MDYFKDKVVWITGASSGFGEALAYEFASKGAKLILSARRLSELDRVKIKIPSSVILVLDLEQSEQLPELVERAVGIYGHIDIMVHNGAIGQRSSVLATTMQKHRQIMEVDYFSYVELTKLLLPHFIGRQEGHFVVTSGFMGKVAMPLRSAYCAAKFALHGFFDSLRAEISNQNINVTLLVPGAMKTNLVKKVEDYAPHASEDRVPESQPGCELDKAAQQAIKAIRAKKFEAYIGNRDKGVLLLLLNRICPDRVKKMVTKQI